MSVDKQTKGLFISSAVNLGAVSPGLVLGLSEANRAQGHSMSLSAIASCHQLPLVTFCCWTVVTCLRMMCDTQEVRKEAKRGHEHARASLSCLSVRGSTFPHPCQRPDSL